MPINTVTYHPKEKSIKIKKDIFYLEKSLTKQPIKNYIGLVNRPMVNTNRNEFDFSCRELLATSPTNRSLVSSRNLNTKKQKTQNSFRNSLMENQLKKDFFMYNRKKNEDFNNFMKELSVYKNKRLNKIKSEI